MGEEGVKLFGFWASPFVERVELALKLKGVEYEYIQEDLLNGNKSADLLRYNPVTKKVPVLVHRGKPVVESLVIIEYIDEAWKEGYPIMPKDPFERAQARFWAKFAQDKCEPAIYGVFSKAGEEQQKALQEAKESLKTLEEALKGRKFFGGETIGYLDIAFSPIAYSLRIVEEITNTDIVNDKDTPLMNAWFDRFLSLEVVKERLPPRDKLYSFSKARRESLLAAQN